MDRCARIGLGGAAIALAIAGCVAPGGLPRDVGAKGAGRGVSPAPGSPPAGSATARPGGSAAPGSTPGPAGVTPTGAPTGLAGTPGPAAAAGVLSGVLRIPGARLIGNNTAGIIANNGGGVVSNNGGAVIANNGSGLVSDNGVGLVGANGSALLAGAFRLLQLADEPVAGAVVTLLDAAGAPVAGVAPATTGPDGGFRFDGVPEGVEVVAEAAFEAGGKAFRFKGLPEGESAAARLRLDVASTLVAEKVLAVGRAGTRLAGLRRDRVAALAEGLRARLGEGTVPFMATTSADVVPSFDQAVLDVPALREAAAELAAPLAEASHTGVVETVIDGEKYRDSDVDFREASFAYLSRFDVDAEGGIYLAIRPQAGPVRVLRMDPSGTFEAVADFPAGEVPVPTFLAVAADGRLWAAGFLLGKGDFVAYREEGGKLVRRPGYLLRLPRMDLETAFSISGGRMVVDARGDVYAALRLGQVVVRLRDGAAEPEIVAGKLREAGYADGDGVTARFSEPSSLAIGPDGAIYVADAGNTCVRRIDLSDPAKPQVSTYAGKPGEATYRSGRAEFARFGAVDNVGFDPGGDLIVSDSVSLRVRRISRDGSVFTLAGTGEAGGQDGPGGQATFSRPENMVVDARGRVYLRDRVPGGPNGRKLVFRRVTR